MEENTANTPAVEQESNSPFSGVAVVVVLLLLVGGAVVLGSKNAAERKENPLDTPQPTTLDINQALGAANPQAQASALPNGQNPQNQVQQLEEVKELKIEDALVGSGTEAQAGKKVSVHYDGYLTNGVKFDSSRERGQAFSFTLGAGEVIPGWDQGVSGMKVGGKRRLTIPPDLGYGAAGAGDVIPPNATLVFDIELLGVE